MIEAAFFHPFIAEQSVQILNERRAFALSKYIPGQINIPAAPSGLSHPFADQIGDEPSIAQRSESTGGFHGFWLLSSQFSQCLRNLFPLRLDQIQ